MGLLDIHAMPKVADMLEGAQMVEVDEEDAGVTIRWLKYKAMWPTASRDFVVRTQGSELSPQMFVVTSKSVEHPNRPPAHPSVRGDVMLSGYVIRAHGEGSMVTLFSHIDLKGNIPSFIINQLGTAAPIKLVKTVREYTEQQYRSNPGQYS
jgi:hypothetical protein